MEDIKEIREKISMLEDKLKCTTARLKRILALDKLQEKQKKLPKIKYMIFNDPSPDELENLPETLQVLIIKVLDYDFQCNASLPLFLKQVYIMESHIEPESLESRFKLPFGCKIKHLDCLKEKINMVEYCKERKITKKNLYTRRLIRKQLYYYNVEYTYGCFWNTTTCIYFNLMPAYINNILQHDD